MQAQLYYELIKQSIEKDDYFKDFKIADYQFIVICNSTRTPLIWEFKGTKSITDCEYGEYKLPNWRKLATELWYYLSEKPKVPVGIKIDEPNDIIEWLNQK